VTVIDGHLNLLWNQRSVDTMLGLPFNIASYGLLLHLLASPFNVFFSQAATRPVGDLGVIGATTFCAMPFLQVRPPFDPVRDLAPVTQLTDGALLCVANAGSLANCNDIRSGQPLVIPVIENIGDPAIAAQVKEQAKEQMNQLVQCENS
jgi:hypothetical protein